MAGVSIVERGKLSLLLGRRVARSVAGRLRGHPALRWGFLPGKPDRLLIAPQDLRTADGTRATEIYAGRFAFAGKVVICDGRSPFEMAPPSDEWAASLLGFGWLRHLRAAESGITRANARALVDEWITLQGSWDPVGWRPDILGRRIIAWLTQSTLILHDADDPFYRKFLRSLARQVRYLHHTALDTADGVPRLQALIALTYASLCMASQSRHLRSAVKRLVIEVERQILPDGGHVSRNPNALAELLLDLMPLRQAFAARNVQPPPQLNNAIDRMMPMLRFFRHGDGVFAHFNGMGTTQTDLLATILAYDDARGTPPANASHSGYQRLEAGETVVLMDAGTAPPLAVSSEAHAGCLSFELSSGLQRIVVNCGLPAVNRDNWRQVARATAAHSTVVFNDTSSARFVESGTFKRLIGTPMTDGPKDVRVAREDRPEGTVVHAAHDGYATRFEIVLHRELMLAADGSRLDGDDMFVPADGESLPSSAHDAFAIRFHLHPSIKASLLSDGHGVTLAPSHGPRWTFRAPEDRVDLEESVYLGGLDGARRSLQMVIYGRALRVPRVRWVFSQISVPDSEPSRMLGGQPELPV